MDERDRWAGLLAEAATERAAQPLRICQLCVELLGVTGGGISMVTTAGNKGVVCATDDLSAKIEELQLTLGEGPCVDAVGGGHPVLIPDLEDHTDIEVVRWPAFIEAAHRAGVRAAFAFPLRVGAITIGALDLYRLVPGELPHAALSGALMAADAAALSLLHLDTGRDSAFADDGETRATYQFEVHQATGMIQVQLGVSTEEAFLRLRAHAFAAARPVVSIARDVVERRLRFTPEGS